MTRLGLISDTHAPRYWTSMPAAVAAAFDGVDLILHAGDVCTPGVLDELETLAPVRVALGNNDGPDVADRGALPVVTLEVDGLTVVVVHDSGPATGRMRRLERRFPEAALVVFGHSHIPWDESSGTLRIVNPGSATEPRRQPYGTVAVLEVSPRGVGDLRLLRTT